MTQKINSHAVTFTIRHECEQLAETLLAKHRNYGGSAFQSPLLQPLLDPETAMKVRLSDKIARLQNLETGDQDAVGESRLDTLLDIAGYAILIRAYNQLKDAPKSEDEPVPEDTPEKVEIPVGVSVIQEDPDDKRILIPSPETSEESTPEKNESLFAKEKTRRFRIGK